MAKTPAKNKEVEIIRTPTKISGPITEEEKVRLKAYTDLWIKNAFRTDNIDPNKIIPAIKGMYVVSEFKEPVVIIVPSPLAMVFAYGAASALIEKNKKSKNNKVKAEHVPDHENVMDNGSKVATSESTNDALMGMFKDGKGGSITSDTRTYDAIVKAVTEILGYTPEIKDSKRLLKDQTNEQQGFNACRDLAGEDGVTHAKKWYENYQGGNMWSYYDCYLTAFRDVLGLRLPIYEKYKYWEVAAKEGGFRVMHEDFCIVSDFPEIIKIDDNNRPHAQGGPSHRWRDGWSLYYWHGVKIPNEWVTDPSSLTASKALTWANMEQRRAACEILGWNNILKELNATIIDTDADPEIGQLLEVNIPEIGRERFLKVLCGTKREFALPVPPNMKTALEAQSWTWGLNNKTFIKPEVRS